MAASFELLFAPLTIRGHELPNRIVLPPMVSHRELAEGASRAWYGGYAAGGAGLVIVEATHLHQFTAGLSAAKLAPLVADIHRHGAKAAIQLFWSPPAGCSNPTELSLAQCREAVDRFAAAARVCAAAGFDGVEVHGAHGFLLNQFFSRLTNHRTDEFGEPSHTGLTIAQAVRESLGAGPLLCYRHTPVQDGGYTLADSLAFARQLVAAGVDVLDISPSSDQAPADLAAPFKALGLAPVIGVGRLGDPDRALAALAEDRCDLVAIGRGLICDPLWPAKVRSGRLEDIIECNECNQGCFGRLSTDLPVECAQRW